MTQTSLFDILIELTPEDYDIVAPTNPFPTEEENVVLSMIRGDSKDFEIMSKITRQHEGISELGYLL